MGKGLLRGAPPEASLSSDGVYIKKPLEEDNRITSQATEVGSNQESSKMESGKNSNNKNKNENDISTVLVLNRSQFVKPKVWFADGNKSN